MNRVIVDYKKLTPEILDLLVEKFPDGYGIRDVIKFTNQHGKYIEAVEVATNDATYLVKISNELVVSMESHEEDDNLDSVIKEDLDLGDVDLIDLEDDE